VEEIWKKEEWDTDLADLKDRRQKTKNKKRERGDYIWRICDGNPEI